MALSAALLDMMPDVFGRLWRGNELCTKNEVESERNTKQRMDCSITRPGSHGRFNDVSAFKDSQVKTLMSESSSECMMMMMNEIIGSVQ